MASSSLLHSLFVFSVFFTTNLLQISANLHRTSLLRSELLSPISTNNATEPPTVFFEVTRPVPVPRTRPCSYLLLRHDFAFTYGEPPVTAAYDPPSGGDCPSHGGGFERIVLEWTAACRGRQFDRIFGVWLSGAELLHSCTAEPRASGIAWTVKKDITRYRSLLMKKNQTLAVFLRNVVDKTYTGVYHVNVSIHFYPNRVNRNRNRNHQIRDSNSDSDLIIPISRGLNSGFWFEILNSTDFGAKEVEIPRNAYRAVLEVYVSYHEDDEFWYGNVPNEYISGNNLTGVPGNGPFREVVVALDGDIVGAVWPFTVIYTGGVNPLLWRPISAIGSFDLPTYDIEITPFLGKMIDGKTHEFRFSVTNALNVWYIDANLHLWLDGESEKTEGALVGYASPPLAISLSSSFNGLNGSFTTNVTRSVSSTGWIRSSRGNITTELNQGFEYTSSMQMEKDGNLQVLSQTILLNRTVHAAKTKLIDTFNNFTIFLHTDYIDQGNGTSLSEANLTLGLSEKRLSGSVENLQRGQGVMVVKKNLVVSGVGSTQQVYKYKGGESCYFRNVSSSNYTVLYDKVRDSCKSKMESRMGFLASELLDHSKGV